MSQDTFSFRHRHGIQGSWSIWKLCGDEPAACPCGEDACGSGKKVLEKAGHPQRKILSSLLTEKEEALTRMARYLYPGYKELCRDAPVQVG